MKHALLSLALVGMLAGGAAAIDLKATSLSITPTDFHWTHRTTGPGAHGIFHFDIDDGEWTAALTSGDVTVSDHGVLAPKDRLPFYHGLARSGVWDLNTPANTPPDAAFNYVVVRYRSEHEVTFGTPTPDFQKVLDYVGSSLIAHEEQSLQGQLQAAPAPAGK